MSDVLAPLSVAQVDVIAQIGSLLNVGVLTVDEHLVITGWNDWLAQATGLPAASVVGRPLDEVEPSLRPAARAAVQRAVSGSVAVMSQGLHGCLITAPAPQGYETVGRMQQSVRILPLVDASGNSAGAAALIEDVTERVAREEELRAAMEEAQLANQAKSAFLASMSHELRTPIGAVSGYADLIAEGIAGPVSEPQRGYLGRIKSVAAHLLNVVDEILTFARLNARREEVRVSATDACVLAREALAGVEPLATKKGLCIRFTGSPESIPMESDSVKIRQILINLLGNAIKFTERGSVELAVVATETTVSFDVVDTGPGIAADDVERIFDPFTQIEAGNLKRHGTGLGLSVSLELARLLGGDITVASEVGVGSRFTTTIPR